MKTIAFILSTFIYSLSLASDPLYDRQWGLENTGQVDYERTEELNLKPIPGKAGIDIDIPSKEQMSQLEQNDVIVAVIDTGIDYSLSDLKGRIWKRPDCNEDDQDKCFGLNLLHKNQTVMDDKGHGTHVAGIIAANIDHVGIRGVSEKIKIMPLKVLSQDVGGFIYNKKIVSDYFAEAIDYAVKNKANVINISAGFPKVILTSKLRKSISNAFLKNIPIIAAAGNNNKSIPVFPCNLKGVICVGAINNQGEITEFSNYGHSVDILAPGKSIISTYSTHNVFSRILRIPGFEVLKGTSQAAPFVSAAAAVLKSVDPSISLNMLKAKLFSAAVDTNSNKKFTMFGLVQLGKALEKTPKDFIYPDVKEDKTNVVIKSNSLDFSYKLYLDKFISSGSEVKVSIHEHPELEFRKREFSFNDSRKRILVPIFGKLKDHMSHSRLKVKFTVQSGEFIKEYNLLLNFTRDVHSFENKKSITLPMAFQNSVFIKGNKKTSLLKYVFSATNKNIGNIYYYNDRSVKDKVKIGVLDLNSTIEHHMIEFEKDTFVESVIHGDFNNDGKNDYLFVIEQNGINKLRYANDKLGPLFKKEFLNELEFKNEDSVLKLSSGDKRLNFLNYEKRLVQNAWVYNKVETEEIALPVFSHIGKIPNDQNSLDFVDYRSNTVSRRHYQLAIEDKSLVAKMLVSVDMESDLIDSLSLNPWDNILVEGIRPQKDIRNTLALVLSIGEGSKRDFYNAEVSFVRKNTRKVELLNLIDTQNLILTLNKSFTSHQPSKFFTESIIFFNLESRNKARISMLSKTNNLSSQKLSSKYSDPYFGFISGVQIEDTKHYFLESRYWIHYENSHNERFIYPVNRESSFPGVEFSETMDSVFTLSDKALKSGVFVNSSLLYGDQVHALIPSEKDIIRPINYSFSIPKNCTYMLPSTGKDSISSFVFNCLENKKSVLKIIEMK